MIRLFQLLFIPLFFTTFAFAQSAGNAGFYNVKDFGATGNGKTLDHQAINKAIAYCAERGGGTVYLPAGNYLCGSIHLKSNINLLIDAGAVITGAPASSKAYDQAEAFPDSAYQDGGHTYFHNSLIWGENLTNVSITGHGRINGGGLTREDHEHGGIVTGGSVGTGDKAIALKLCTNVLIRDITIFHGGHFAVLVTGCNMLTLDNLTIDSNRDGIDIDCCKNTMVSNCRVNTPNDDGICPKSSYALNKPVLTENLVITNCELSGFKEGTLLSGEMLPSKLAWAAGRIKFGTESNGGFRNCTVSNCTFRNCSGLALEEVDGGMMDNIIVSNITMINIGHYPIYVTLGKRNRGPKATTHMGMAKNILISNIQVTNADSLCGIQLTGTPGYPLENVRLQNIFVQYLGGGIKEQGQRVYPELDKGYPEPFLLGMSPAYGLFARHINGLQLDNISFTTKTRDDRAVLIASDVHGLEINGFRSAKPTGEKPFRFEQVDNLRIENSPVISDSLK